MISLPTYVRVNCKESMTQNNIQEIYWENISGNATKINIGTQLLLEIPIFYSLLISNS